MQSMRLTIICLAIPGKIVMVEGQQATVDFDGISKEINVSLVEVEEGDYVIVHAGFAIEKMGEEEATLTLKEYGK